jgi:hypothetical protein
MKGTLDSFEAEELLYLSINMRELQNSYIWFR